jgi:hypothetical protein
MRKLLLTAIVASIPIAAHSGSFLTRSQLLQVNPVSDTTFEVIEDSRSSKQAYWCTAGRHVTDVLRRHQSRIYIARGRGPSETVPGRKAVLFSIVPVGDEPKTPFLTTKTFGAHEGSGYAVRLCEDLSRDFGNR